MIETPYKLDLILNTQYKPNVVPDKINRQTQQTQQTQSKYEEQDKKINLTKPIVDIEINSFVNKLKLIILNMGLSDIYWLEADKKTGFDLKIEITNNYRLNEKNYSEYVIANGIVGPIKLNSDSKLRDYINFDTDELVVKPIDYQIESIDEFINKWKDDKNLYPANIPEIYFYGMITNNSGDLLSYYYITKKYPNHTDIIKHNDFNFSLSYLKKLLGLFDNLISRKYVYRNLNMFGLGYEMIPNSIDFSIIILDYNITTLLDLENKFFNQFMVSRCGDKKCIGYLTPYYIIDDYYNFETNWLPRLNKFYSLGLVEIILILFYTNDVNLSKVYDFVVGPSVFESQLHYYHFYKRFNSDINTHNLNLLINELKLRYCDINPLMETELKLILVNLLDKDYDKIHFPHQIMELIERIEKSNKEFEIKYSSKEDIYNPIDDNYLKTNIDIKQKILSEDNLKSNDEYYNLYKKYKNKYLNLKNFY